MFNKVRIERRNLGISQNDFSNLLGVSRQTISNIELFKCDPSGVLMLRIAKILKKPVEELFFDEFVKHDLHKE